MPERMQSYLERVQEQIRWKRARPVLIQELARHLEDQRDDFIKEGKTPEEAERLAVEDMGDPVAVGTELDRIHHPRPQWGLLGLTLALAAVGVFLRVTFSQIGGDSRAYFTHTLERALLSLGLGTAVMLAMYFLDVSRLVRHARALYFAALATTVLFHLLFYPTYFYSTYSISLTLAFYPLVYALWLYSFRDKRWKGLFLSIFGGVPLAMYLCRIPYGAGLFLLLFSGLTVTLYAAGRDWFGVGRWKGLWAVLAVPAVLAAYLFSRGYLSSFLGRVQIALHPELDPKCRGFIGSILRMFWEDVPPLRHYGNVGAAIHAGARVRVYTGSPFVSEKTVPVGYSHDYLPASIAVQWGWVPLLVLLAALAVLLLWLLVKGLRQSYLPGRFVVLAVALTLGLQTLFSAAMNFGFVLFSASLPLIVGNRQTVVNMALIGLALSVFRGDSIAREEPNAPLRQRKRLRVRIEYQ
ncbi:MAG: hypothetical protein HFG05_00685 [Oscillibacter sp.]|nr:hypothetical protein [Oscillibacter sp.]